MKSPLALLINDLHITKENIKDFEDNWMEAVGVCEERKIDTMIVGGDLFTSRSSQTLAVLLSVRNMLKYATDKKIMVILANGNHDKVDQESIYGYCHLFSHMMGVLVVDEWEYIETDDSEYSILVMPYFPENGSFKDKLEMAIASRQIDKTILYIHEGIHGALGNMDLPDELPQELFNGFYKVLSGHYHNRTRIRKTNIEYIGSSRQNNFGEDEEKGYTIVFSDGSTEFVKNNVNPRYINSEVRLENIAPPYLNELKRYQELNPVRKIKVKVLCFDKDITFEDKQKLYDAGAYKIEVSSEKTIAVEVKGMGIDEKYDKQEIKKKYVGFCSKKGVDKELGLKYLNEIN